MWSPLLIFTGRNDSEGLPDDESLAQRGTGNIDRNMTDIAGGSPLQAGAVLDHSTNDRLFGPDDVHLHVWKYGDAHIDFEYSLKA
jgi:hypothetical protein